MDVMADAVRAFHEKHGYPVDACLPNDGFNTHLEDIRSRLETLVETYEAEGIRRQAEGDPRLYRMCLMMEELGEMAHAMSVGNRTLLLDAGADLQYVLTGTVSVTYSLPLDAAFWEVHRSNMTKQVRDPDADPRMRSKGEDYSPPDLGRIIRQHECPHEWTSVVTVRDNMSSEKVRCTLCGLNGEVHP